jgi:hypothetical protein
MRLRFLAGMEIFIWLIVILGFVGLVFGGWKGARIGAGIGIIVDVLVVIVLAIWAFWS